MLLSDIKYLWVWEYYHSPFPPSYTNDAAAILFSVNYKAQSPNSETNHPIWMKVNLKSEQ